ncbi:MAG: ATP-dependent DNA ligase [Nanoarchaeota archaeon]|nr:ATP-dependent DNA ligase [Nanoarchaeota archaeon]
MEYKNIVEIYKKLEKTSKRLEKVEIIQEFLKDCDDLKDVIYLLEGRIFPEWDERKIGISSQLVLKIISQSCGENKDKVEKLWKKEGDLGKVIEILFKNKKQTTLSRKKLDVKKVVDNIQKLPEFEGKGTINKKIQLIVELLNNADGEEARFIVNTVLENLRVGVASGIIRDSIAKAFDKDVKDVENKYNLITDYGEIAELAKKNKLKSVSLKVGRPIKSMLAIKLENIKDAFKALGETVQAEYKLDGFRLNIHKDKEIKLFTRNLEDVTKQFDELINVVKENVKGKSFILDCEVVGFDSKTGRYLPFQSISQRIKRKYDIEDMAKKFPVELHVFDVLYYNGKNLMDKSLKERRELLEKILKEKEKKIVLTKKLVSDNERKIGDFYKEALKNGHEGIMIKNLGSKYIPGRYVNGWIKLKPVLESLDLVILKGVWGEGKRSNWLSSFTLACSNGDKFLDVGKVGTGIKEKGEGVTFKTLTKELKKYILKENGKEVILKPKLIVEINYEEIQKSPSYSSGYALRFPRVLRIRGDKSIREINTLEDIKRIYSIQKR